MRVVVLGCGYRPHPGALNVDLDDGPHVDVATNLDDKPWLWFPGRVELVLADHVLEHLVDPLGALIEAARLSPAGAWLCATTPHEDHPDALDDPTHRHLFPDRWGQLVETRTPWELIDTRCQGGHAHPLAWHADRYLGTQLDRRNPGERLWVFKRRPESP